MASLQVDNYHICSSGLFKKGFLLTTAECSEYIASCVNQEKRKGTAVLGGLNLKDGQRVNLLHFAYTANDKSYKYHGDVGIVMVGR